MQNEEQVRLVNEDDVQIGTMGKLETHEKGLLHRAFSIIVKNEGGEVMLQKRAVGKYHSGGLWTNTCCGHPRVDEELIKAAHRRLREEMGFDCELKEVISFMYQADLDKGLKENEFLHVFVGEYNDTPIINPAEADVWKWIAENELRKNIADDPDVYTYWFKVVLKKIEEKGIAL